MGDWGDSSSWGGDSWSWGGDSSWGGKGSKGGGAAPWSKGASKGGGHSMAASVWSGVDRRDIWCHVKSLSNVNSIALYRAIRF